MNAFWIATTLLAPPLALAVVSGQLDMRKTDRTPLDAAMRCELAEPSLRRAIENDAKLTRLAVLSCALRDAQQQRTAR